MEKLILLIFAVILLVNNINSQTDGSGFRKKFVVGLKIGANYSNVFDVKDNEFKTSPKIGFVSGAFVAVPVSKLIGFQPEILISQKGFHATGMILGNTYKFTRKTTYIDIPLLFTFKPKRLLTVLAGPMYSYLAIQQDIFIDATSTNEQQQVFKNDNFRKNVFCLSGGVDINLGHFVVGTRVGWDLLKNSKDGTSMTPQYKNNWFQLTLGYRSL
jgi:hypothetical protein